MAKITIDELSDALKDHLNNLGINEEQLKEIIEGCLELEGLQTENKNLVGAINELFQNVDSGKQIIADAIDNETVNKESTFSEIGAAIEDIRNDRDESKQKIISVLQENNVEITEEDDMTSLLNKVDTVIDNKNAEMQAEKQKLVNFLTTRQINVSMSNTMEEITSILAENLPKIVTASDNVLASYSAYFEYSCLYKGSLKVTYTITVSPAYADTSAIGTTLHHRRNGSDVDSWYSYHSTSNGTSATYTRTITGIEPGDIIFADAAFSYISSAKICGTVI